MSTASNHPTKNLQLFFFSIFYPENCEKIMLTCYNLNPWKSIDFFVGREVENIYHISKMVLTNIFIFCSQQQKKKISFCIRVLFSHLFSLVYTSFFLEA